ncbi:MAG TPA: hypothetical protein VF131_05850 [Blastocatellia bacterium]|nr:hypothetical protein [Blastocatellia bacterium]
MQMPETPKNIEQLDLMIKLKSYADGQATWSDEKAELGTDAKLACLTLYNSLVLLVNKVFAPLLDRVTAREMETYTMHDHVHGLKVAHLMWHILDPDIRSRLTPPEIALLVCSAHLHDMGMGLNREEREARLDPASDLWNKLELDDALKTAMDELRSQVGNESLSESVRKRASRKLFQAEEALLTQDTRTRHATPQRYKEILGNMWRMHQSDPENIPDIQSCLSFDGDSFKDKLIDICVSHNEDAEALVEADKKHSGRPRFPSSYPIGCSVADLHMVAAVLRLADILDFDRERTPPALFHYLLPGPLGEPENDSGREWGKHLAISNWYIEEDAVVFRGRCKSHIIHHAVVLFASDIEREIIATRSTFGALKDVSWPCKLPTSVKVDIHEDGYRYIPYKFELDDDRVYSLLMGGAIYDDPLDAVHEMVQNAVDACKLRDALTQIYDQTEPRKNDRILIRYEEPGEEHKQPRLTIQDTGIGMDALIIERYFLKVGRSYYNSSEFNQIRFDLRKHELDFAPVSEFGVGFLSAFLLANRVEVQTAMWESPRGDTTKRTLQIDGPTRLIRLSEERNEGPRRFKGTKITLNLSQGDRENGNKPPAWQAIKEYIQKVCQDLPYRLNLEYISNGHFTEDFIDPVPLKVELPYHLESAALRIPVNDETYGLEGEMAFVDPYARQKVEEDLFEEASVLIIQEGSRKQAGNASSNSSLLRGGFKVGAVPGLFGAYQTGLAWARIRVTWKGTPNRRYVTTNLARNATSDSERLEAEITRLWLTYFLEHFETVPAELLLIPTYDDFRKHRWLEKYNAFRIYELASKTWHLSLKQSGVTKEQIEIWEQGSGDPLRLRYGFYRDMLNLVLPRITTLQMDPDEYYYVKPPRPDWRAVLSNCNNYITEPTSWGLFAEYTKGIQDVLYYSDYGGGYLNSQFQDRLISFNTKEVKELRYSLGELINSNSGKRQARMTPERVALIKRLQEVAGELEVGSRGGRWRLDSFKF